MTRWASLWTLVVGLSLSACGGGSTPSEALNEAIVLRDIDAVKAHLAAGADVNAADELGNTPLIAAVPSGQPEVVRLLLDAGADLNARGTQQRKALHFAIQAEQPEMALLLLEQEGIDVEARDAHGSTPLVEAIALGQMDVATTLLKQGADINGPGPVGRTALHVAAASLHPDWIPWLLERGANADARDFGGKTPIHYAAASPMPAGLFDEDFQGTFLLLLEASSDVNAVDANGATPLHYSVAWAEPWLLRVLLDAGADPSVRDRKGRSPVYYVTTAEQARLRPKEESLAILTLFKTRGLTEESVVDDQGTTVRDIESDLSTRP